MSFNYYGEELKTIPKKSAKLIGKTAKACLYEIAKNKYHVFTLYKRSSGIEYIQTDQGTIKIKKPAGEYYPTIARLKRKQSAWNFITLKQAIKKYNDLQTSEKYILSLNAVLGRYTKDKPIL